MESKIVAASLFSKNYDDILEQDIISWEGVQCESLKFLLSNTESDLQME